MESMLRQRGYLQDHHDKNSQTNSRCTTRKQEFEEEDIEKFVEETGKDSVPSLCRTGMDSTIQTGLTITGTTMEQLTVPRKESALGRVKTWLEGIPLGLSGMDISEEEEVGE